MGWIVSTCRLFHRKIPRTPKQPPGIGWSGYLAIPTNILAAVCFPVQTDPGIFAGFLWLFPSVLDLPEYGPLSPCEVLCFFSRCVYGRRHGSSAVETPVSVEPVLQTCWFSIVLFSYSTFVNRHSILVRLWRIRHSQGSGFCGLLSSYAIIVLFGSVNTPPSPPFSIRAAMSSSWPSLSKSPTL